MRDIALTAFVLGLVPFILRNPLIGVYTWAWLGMMNPHAATYDFARMVPFSQIVAVTTLVSMLISRRPKRFPADSIAITLVLLTAWMCVTSLFALNPDGQLVQERLIFVLKIQVMLVATLLIVRGRTDIERLLWVMVLSIGFYGIKGGVWTVLTGGGHRVWGPPGSLIAGNNELAVALVMLQPLFYYFYQVSARRWLRWLLVGAMAAMAFAILGSQSRGALLALVAMAFFLGLKGKYPIRTSLLLIAGLTLAIGFMPETWVSRMDTIQSYQSDTSAMSRIWTWKTLWACAVDRPLVGGGFASDNPVLFARYAPQDPEFEMFRGSVYVAHSIFFQFLGEHGFVGFGLFLLLGIYTWRTAGRLARETRDDARFGTWVPILMPMVQVSLVGYAVGGAFLSMGYFDLPYYIVAIVSMTQATVREHQQRVRQLEPQATPSAPATS